MRLKFAPVVSRRLGASLVGSAQASVAKLKIIGETVRGQSDPSHLARMDALRLFQCVDRGIRLPRPTSVLPITGKGLGVIRIGRDRTSHLFLGLFVSAMVNI